MALPTSLPSLPPIRFLDIDTWTEPITISQRPVDALTYFHVEIPEDAAGVKLMVDQLAGGALRNPLCVMHHSPHAADMLAARFSHLPQDPPPPPSFSH